MSNFICEKGISAVAWDFNGTLLDDLSIGIDAINRLLERRELPLLDSKERYREVFDFPVIDYYRRLGLDVEGEGYDALAVEWVSEYEAIYRERAAVREGALYAVKALYEKGVPQYIVSASEIGMLLRQASELSLDKYMKGIYGQDNIHAHGKTEIVKRWADTVDKSRAVYIGDTTHDFETARAAGVRCILITGGHHSWARLAKTGAEVVNGFTELTELLSV